jgi:hypothetical protein
MPKSSQSSDIGQPSTEETGLASIQGPGSAPLSSSIDMNAALETISGLGTRVAAETTAAPVEAAEAKVDDDLARGGPAFGTFIKSVGLAVAETQRALDLTLVETTKALADATVKTVAVFEQELNDDGTLKEGKAIVQEVPVLSFISPTSYAFTQVHLTADMDVSEFNTANGLNIKSSSFGAGLKAEAKYGLTGFSGSANLDVRYDSSENSEQRSASERRAAGKLHLEATMEPRRDIGMARPILIQRGPRLQLSSTRETLDAAGNPTTDSTKIAGRRATITARLMKSDGSGGITGQTLQVDCDHPALNYTIDGPTDGDGKSVITVDRVGAAFDAKTKVSATIRIGLNLIQETLQVTL